MSLRGRILVVEDNATSRKVFRLALEAEGYAVVEAADAQAGTEALARESYDVVLQDLVLPDMHGFDLVKKLRALPHGTDVPIIAVSGFLSRLEEAQAIGVGFTSLLVKPVEPSLLVQTVASFLPERRIDQGLDGTGRRVLVVNDDAVQLKLLRLRLAMAGFEVLSADSGGEALRLAREHLPEAILSDVLMPGMDGFELCLAVRSDSRLRRIPVVLASAHYGSASDHELARRVGANALVQNTAEFAEVPPALARALQQGAPEGAVDPDQLIRADHAGAVSRQLEKQLQSVSGIAQRCTLLSAEIALLSSVSAALAHDRDPAVALKSVLATTLDAAGISKGALYLRDSTRCLQFNHAIGFDRIERERLDGWLGVGADRPALAAHVSFSVADAGLDPGAADLLAGLGVTAVQFMPLKSRNEDFGLLVLGARRVDVVSHDAIDFAQSFAGQIVQALELERAFAQTAESELRLRQMAETIQEVFFLTDAANSRLLYVNPAYERIWGRSCQSLYADPRSWLDAVYPDDLVGTQEHLARMAVDGRFEHAYRIRRDDGSMRWVSMRCVPVRVAAVATGLVVGVAEDVTESRLAQKAVAASEARYRQLFNANPLPEWVYDLDTLAFLAVNDAAVAHYGYSREEFLAMTIADIRPEADLPALGRSIAASTEGIEHAGIWQHRKRDGSLIFVEITSHTIPFEDRRAKLVLAHDVTYRHEQERKIGRLNRIRAVIGSISSAMLRLSDRSALLREACRVATTEGVFPMAWVASFDPATQTFAVLAAEGGDPAGCDVVGLIGDRSGEPAHLARFVANDLATEPALAPVRETLLQRGFTSIALFPLRVEGRLDAVLVLLSGERDFFDEEEIALLEWLSADLSFALEHISHSQRLRYLAFYDPLTELANEHLFLDRLEQFVSAARHDGSKVCVVVIDLEDFTRINDSHGRKVGDDILREMGLRLRRGLVEPYALGRIGADTFAAASPRDNGHIATHLRASMLEVLDEPFTLATGQKIHLDAQAGIAIFPGDGEDAATLFKNAEVALKLARSSGDGYAYYSIDMHERMAQRRAVEQQLRSAVDDQQFVVHYQARIDMTSGELIGAEALIRWMHPERGLLAPADFLAFAEETILIVPIGDWIIRQVCAQQAAWLACGVAAVPIAVNVSSIQLEHGDVVRTVREALATHSLAPRYLQLELTESAVMIDPERATRTLRTLQDLGVELALDDFGTGYSSLAHLKRFPFRAVKIDRSFVTDITSNPEDAAIASAVIAMAHRLGLEVIAEGVETQGQFNHLRDKGCDGMQGYFFSRPLPTAEFEMQLRSGKRVHLPAPVIGDERSLLIVDDEPGIRAALKRTLRRDGYNIFTASSGAEGLEILALNRVQVVISDQRMPEMTGTDFLSIVKQLYPDTLRIILSGYTDLDVVTDSVNRGAVYKFLTKPWDDVQLRELVRDAFRSQAPSKYQKAAHSS